jgi:hypothetical protein
MRRYLDAIAIIALGVAVTILGEPPLSLFVGAAGAVTGCFALYGAITHGGDD